MPGNDAWLLVVPGSDTSQLQDLGSQVLYDCCHVNRRTSSNSLGVVALPTHDNAMKEDHTWNETWAACESCLLGTEDQPCLSGTWPFPWPCCPFLVQTFLKEEAQISTKVESWVSAGEIIGGVQSSQVPQLTRGAGNLTRYKHIWYNWSILR